MPVPTLILDPAFEITQKISHPTIETKLGDGYTQRMSLSDSPVEEWEVSRSGLTTLEINDLLFELEQYSGVQGFYWSPNEYEPANIYTCDGWQHSLLAPDLWSMSATFKKDQSGQCAAFRGFIQVDEIKGFLAGANDFLARYTRDQTPLMINSQGLTVNAFHDVLGRGGYFPGSAGTSEGQAVGARACMYAYKATGNVAWKNRAIFLANAGLTLYPTSTPPDDPSTLWVAHWLFCVKYAFPTKGKNTNDPLNLGHYDTIIDFVNGEGIIPTANSGQRLAGLHKVYSINGLLLWQNIFAPVISGTNYEIEYWVTNFLLRGQAYRFYPDTEASGGRSPTLTNEPYGKIKLKSNYTGKAKLVYTSYNASEFILPGEKFEAYPAHRRLLPTEYNCAFDSVFWMYQSYDLLWKETGDLKWYKALEATRVNAINTAVIPNISHYLRESDNPDPFFYPGSQLIQINNPNGYTVSRVLSGNKKDWIKVSVNAAPNGSFPSCEVQNFAVQTGFTEDTNVFVAYAHSNETLMEVVLSTNPNAFDQSQLYKAEALTGTPSIDPKTKTFVASDFYKWDDPNVIWHPTVAENAIFTYNGGGGTVSKTLKQETIGDNKPIIWQVNLDSNEGFAGCGFVFFNSSVRPPRLRFSLAGDPIKFRLKDHDDVLWERKLQPTNGWETIQRKWSDFTYSDQNEVQPKPDDLQPSTQGKIKQFEFAADGEHVLKLHWATADEPPATLPVPCIVFKAALVDRDKDQHDFYCGNFKPTGNTFDTLNYNPGVVPFTVNLLNGGIDAWRGIPLAGYQDPGFWRSIGYEDRCVQATQFLKDAQDAYTAQSQLGIVGPFAPAYSWAYWDNGDYLANGLNQFGWSAPDPNTRWAPYSYRALVGVAEALRLDPGDQLAKTVTMRFLTYLDENLSRRNSIKPLTDFPPVVEGQQNYNEPHSAALILRAALYANLANCNPDVTFRLIKKMYDFIKSQYVYPGASQTMVGSFSNGQPAFVENGQTFTETFYFWEQEIIQTLSELILYNDQITLPSCATPLN